MDTVFAVIVAGIANDPFLNVPLLLMIFYAKVEFVRSLISLRRERQKSCPTELSLMLFLHLWPIVAGYFLLYVFCSQNPL